MNLLYIDAKAKRMRDQPDLVLNYVLSLESGNNKGSNPSKNNVKYGLLKSTCK